MHLNSIRSFDFEEDKLRPRFHGQFFFDKVGLSQKNMLLKIQFCGEVSLSNIFDKCEPAN